MAGKTRTKARNRKASRERHKRPFEKLGEGLQKELDAIVAPIGIGEKDHPERTGALTERTPDKAVPKETRKHEGEEEAEPEAEKGDKPRRRKPRSSGIAIGETD